MSSAVEGREATVAALAVFLIVLFNTAYGMKNARQTSAGGDGFAR